MTRPQALLFCFFLCGLKWAGDDDWLLNVAGSLLINFIILFILIDDTMWKKDP